IRDLYVTGVQTCALPICIAPAFGAAYLSATVGYGANASEPYLMSRGNPYGSDSFPKEERLARTFLAMTHGSQAAQSLGWPGQEEIGRASCRERRRRRWGG